MIVRKHTTKAPMGPQITDEGVTPGPTSGVYTSAEGATHVSVTPRAQLTDVRWYPMRIFHSSTRRQDDLNEDLKNEAAVVNTYVAKSLTDAEKMTYVSVLKNYIFIRTTLNDLRTIKANQNKYGNLRYVVNVWHDKDNNPVTEIAYVPDKQMEDFIRVIENANEQVLLLENMEFACKPGQKVRIRKGVFEGVEGTLKSMKKHLCVVIPVNGITAVAITNIPKKYLQKIEDE